jgi:hypothetical protein
MNYVWLKRISFSSLAVAKMMIVCKMDGQIADI